MDIWQFTQNQPPQKLETIASLPDSGFIWIDGQPDEVLNVIAVAEKLTNGTVNERHVHDCLNPNHPSFFDSTQLYDLMIFRSLIPSPSVSEINTAPIVFILFQNLIVTFNHADTDIAKLKIRLTEGQKRIPQEPEELIYIILNEVVDNFLELRDPLSNKLTIWQNRLLGGEQKMVRWINLLNFKTEIRKLRMISEEQQEVIYQWRQARSMEMTEQLRVRFNDLSDHIRRILRYMIQLEHELDTLVQLYYSNVSTRTNEVVRVLTVISAIFLPLNLIAGIFGMNFLSMKIFQLPQGHYYAFLGMAAVAITLFILFHWKKWI